MRTAASLVRPRSGSLAFGGLLAFLFLLDGNPGNWFDGLENVGFAKMAAGFALAALGGAWIFYGHRLTLGGRPGLAICALFGWVALSALWSVWPGYTVDTFTDGVKYLAIFLVTVNVLDDETRLGRFVAAMAWATLLPAVGAIWSWAHGEHLVEGDRAGWIGVFGNPNELAYHLVVGTAIILGARDASRRRWARVLYLVELLPVGFAILLTQSRGGMLAAGAVLGWWAFSRVVDGLRLAEDVPAAVRARLLARRRWSAAAGVLGVAAAVGMVLWLAGGTRWDERMESARAFGEDVSARGRVDAWRTGGNMMLHNPLTGVGAGAFVVAWPDYAPGDVGEARTEHNTFIQLTAELGLTALALFVGALVGTAVGLRRAARAPLGPRVLPLVRAAQGGLIGFTMCSLTGGRAWSWPVYLVLGLALALVRYARAWQLAPAEAPVRPHRLLAAAGAR